MVGRGAPGTIHVQTQGRVVTLTGAAPTGLEMRLAGYTAANTSGVKTVVNETDVQTNSKLFGQAVGRARRQATSLSVLTPFATKLTPWSDYIVPKPP